MLHGRQIRDLVSVDLLQEGVLHHDGLFLLRDRNFGNVLVSLHHLLLSLGRILQTLGAFIQHVQVRSNAAQLVAEFDVADHRH